MLHRRPGSDDEWLLYGTAQNPGCPPRLLQRLSGHDHDWARRGAAENPASSPDLLIDLASDPSTSVRNALIARPDLPAAALPALGGALPRESPAKRANATTLPSLPAAPNSKRGRRRYVDRVAHGDGWQPLAGFPRIAVPPRHRGTGREWGAPLACGCAPLCLPSRRYGPSGRPSRHRHAPLKGGNSSAVTARSFVTRQHRPTAATGRSVSGKNVASGFLPR